jgi:hypothetical protein
MLGQVRRQYIIRGKEVRKMIDSRDPASAAMAEKLGLISMA